jgi:acyl-CoA thioester hydrolase
MAAIDSKDLLRGFPVILEMDISWGDMDVYGHVNNTRYFRYFEDARIRYWETLAFTEEDAPRHLGVIVASTSCKFRAPLTYPDRIFVAARVLHLDEQRFSMSYKIISQKLGKIAAMGDALMVGYDLKDLRPMNFTERVRDKIRAMEQSCGNRVDESVRD